MRTTRGESRPLLLGPSSSPPPPLWDHAQTASLVSVGEGGGGERRGGEGEREREEGGGGERRGGEGEREEGEEHGYINF